MLVFSVFVRFGNNVSAQAPQNFNFQAVARDASGNLLANQSAAFRISILQASAIGTSVYVETHPKTTNAFGQATLSIGGGTVLSGNFSTINWGAGNYYLKIEMDATGGSSFVPMGTTQLLSVPYALYSNTDGSGGTTYMGGTGIEVTGTTISNTQPNATHTSDATGSEALAVVKIQGRDVASTAPEPRQA